MIFLHCFDKIWLVLHYYLNCIFSGWYFYIVSMMKFHWFFIILTVFSLVDYFYTGSYDGEIVIWNTNSEHSSRHLTQRMKKRTKSRSSTFVTKTREVPYFFWKKKSETDPINAPNFAENHFRLLLTLRIKGICGFMNWIN